MPDNNHPLDSTILQEFGALAPVRIGRPMKCARIAYAR
jgi:hypothetical protein